MELDQGHSVLAGPESSLIIVLDLGLRFFRLRSDRTEKSYPLVGPRLQA